jgi:ethanolamine-phosphate cytidylyltransferase
MPLGIPDAVYHGPTAFIPLTYDPYIAPKTMAIFREIDCHPFQHVNAGEIVQRILKSRTAYEERQRAKMSKSIMEEASKQREDREHSSRTY